MRPLLLAVALAAPVSASNILVVGDSHTVGAFGQSLDDALRAAPGARVGTYGVCSARPASYFSETAHGCGYLFRGVDKKAPSKWLGARVFKEKRPDGKGGVREVEMVKTPELAQLLSDHNPDAVIVALGSNVPISAASVADTVDLVRRSGAACFWVGPPEMRRPSRPTVDGVYATLRDQGITATADPKSACRLIDSRAFSYLRYPKEDGDGTHYGGSLASLASRWGADAAAAVLKVLTP